MSYPNLVCARLSIAARRAAEGGIFIGHGRDTQWRELRDHLQDQHGYDVLAYETAPRAGWLVGDVLEEMLSRASFAVLVMTAEDETADGAQARQNVVHEVGLCQGRLGLTRAIPLKENGVNVFSNLAGVNWITFDRGNIQAAFGEVLGALKRELHT
ncbi:MAG: nucleotide-binding protein [Acidimicrobiia bacterium]|nr:nucleotide-binding protein [Acidimicrobiia bacterium]